MRKIAAAVFCCAALAGELSAGAPVPPWKVALQARLTERFDPGQASLRRAAAVAGGRKLSAVENIVVGGTHPELLLPSELMDHLTLGFTTDDAMRAEYRSKWQARGAEVLLGPGYLDRVERHAAAFLAANADILRIGAIGASSTGGLSPQLREQYQRASQSLCPLRADALRVLREEFGRETFDRFLYEAVAPDAVMLTTSSDGDPSSVWMWVEEGCP